MCCQHECQPQAEDENGPNHQTSHRDSLPLPHLRVSSGIYVDLYRIDLTAHCSTDIKISYDWKGRIQTIILRTMLSANALNVFQYNLENICLQTATEPAQTFPCLSFSGLYSVNIIKIKKSPLIEPTVSSQDVLDLGGNCLK